MATSIHQTAIVDPQAVLGNNVSIGPFTVVESDVRIGDNTQVSSHVLLASGTRIGSDCRIFKGSSIGEEPQDLKFGGEKSELIIGDHTTIREFCTLNRGTHATGKTVIGSHCLLMAYCHVAHDCVLGDHVIAANCMNIAGHVTIGNHVGIGGMCAIVQFRKIGDWAFIGSSTCIIKDVLPFALVAPDPVRIVDCNKVGLQRNGFDETRRRDIKRAYKILFRENRTVAEALQVIEKEFPGNDDIGKIVTFARGSEKGLMRMGGQD